MRKRNKTKQLQRTHSHRKAMLNNMVTSFFYHEQIQSTVAKAKVTQRIAERMITKAKKANAASDKPEVKIHNLRIVERAIKNKEVLHKLFDDIGPRFADRNGGYTRVIKTGRRASDNAEMAVLQLLDKKDLVQLKEERKEKREERKKKKK